MPDATLKTISATQSPALWNASPYLTKWMLWKHFHDGMDISSPPNSRMDWGTRLQELILEQAASDLAFEVRPNHDYARRGKLGCTRDAIVICPDRGPGTLETKCVFDYRDWMSKWGGGECVPHHYEIQTQQQMLVGDPDGEPYKWGIIATWVAGDVHYFERSPIPELWKSLEEEADAFFQSLGDGSEPDPFGDPIEIPFLSKIERTEGKVLEVDDETLAALAREYKTEGATERAAKKRRDEIKARLLALSDDADELRLPGGVSVKIKVQKRAGYEVKPTTFATIKVGGV